VEEARRSVQPKLGKAKGKKVQVRHSFDNTTIHESAMKNQRFKGLLEEMGWKMQMRQPLSTYSPDLHQVIEHSHGRAMSTFNKWLYESPTKKTLEEYKEKFEQIFKEECTKEIISADVQRLSKVYKWVKDHHGDWAPKSLR
jgi:hypothetical protein